MIALGAAIAALIILLMCLLTFVQTLYMESSRLRTREFPALTYFKETLEDAIGAKPERGVLALSLIKHTLLVILALVFFALSRAYRGAVWQAFAEAGLFTWLAMVVFTYLVPQFLYRRTTGKWLRPLTPLLRLLVKMVSPVISLLMFLESLAELAEPERPDPQTTDANENIEALISAGEEEGIIEEDDGKLIKSVVAFGDMTVREVMTSRPNIVAIAIDRSLEDLRQLVINEQYSRIPVFEGNIDRIAGFVHVRDMFELEAHDRKAGCIRDVMRPIRSVPETKPVDDLLREMQQDGAHMAIVVDEYGNTAGLATMEDLVEEILGEIHDEHEPDRDFQEKDGSYLVAGSLDIGRLEDLFAFRPEEDTESTTVGGLMTEWLGHVPHVGETIERDGLRLEVLAGNELRVEKLKVSKTGNGTHA